MKKRGKWKSANPIRNFPPMSQKVKCYRCNGTGILYVVDGVPIQPGRCCDCGGKGEVIIKGVPMEATL